MNREVKQEETKVWNPMFISLMVCNVLMSIGMQMTNSILAKYTDSLGESATTVGMVVSMFTVTSLLFRIVAGSAIDTYNRKHLFTGSLAIMAAAFIGHSFSKTVPMLICSSLLQGVAMSFLGPVCLAIAVDSLPKDQISSGVGYFSLSMVASQAIAPALGLALSGRIGYSNTFRVSAGVVLITLLLASRLQYSFEKTKKLTVSLNNIVAMEAFVPMLTLFFLGISSVLIQSFLVIYATNARGVSNIGYYFTVYAMALLISRPLIGKLADRFGTAKVVIPGLFCFAGALVLISFSTSLLHFLVVAVVYAFGFCACQPAIQALAMKFVSKERRGVGSNTCYLGSELGMLVSPAISGRVVENMGYQIMWRAMTIPVFIAILIIFAFRKRIAKADAGLEGS